MTRGVLISYGVRGCASPAISFPSAVSGGVQSRGMDGGARGCGQGCE
jgi:hypothetical protein